MTDIFKFIKLNKKGQSLVEFALVMPIFLSLILGMLEFGWIFNGQITLTSAAREGARAAAVGKSAQTAAEKSEGVSSLEDITAVSSSVTIDGANTVKVDVTANIKPLVGLFVQEDPVKLSATAYMRRE